MISQCTSCMDGSGYRSGESTRASAVADAANIRRVAALAIAIDNAMQAVENYRKQRDIARRSLQISKKQQEQLQTVYWPREQEFLAEFGTPEAIESIEVMGRRYGGRLVAAVAGAFATALKEARCGSSRYCTSANSKMMQDLLLARSTTLASARVLGRNIAFAEFQARTDTNFNRRMQAVALGRGLMGQAASLLSSAAGGLANVGNILGGRLSSAIEAFGYAGARSQADMNRVAADSREIGQAAAREAYTPSSAVNPFSGDALRTLNGVGYQSMNTGLWEGGEGNFGQSGFGDASTLGNSNMFDAGAPTTNESMDDADVGDDDLVRTGVITYVVAGISGGTVTVDMDQFGLKFADDQKPRPSIPVGAGMAIS